MRVTVYDPETGLGIWRGEIDVVILANQDTLSAQEVQRLEGLSYGEQLEVGAGFRVVADLLPERRIPLRVLKGRVPLRVIKGGLDRGMRGE
jgi:hypothetical protein